MAISILFGPGGSGKSFYQVKIIVKQLRETKRNVCTNLSLDVPKLAAYLERKYPNESLQTAERIRILNIEETKEFWKYRGPMKYSRDLMGEEQYTENKGTEGVCYVIDEAGAAGFNAQAWAQSTGRTTLGVECCWYLDQQRKFGDDIYASTNGRMPNGIAKGFRDKAHYFIQLRNGYLRSVGIFRARGQFTAKEYTQEPGPNVEPAHIAHWTFEKDGLQECYRTAEGVGVVGSKADIGARAKGIPVLWVFPMAIALGALCIFIPWLLGKASSKFVGGTQKAQAAAISKIQEFREQPIKKQAEQIQTQQFGIVSGLIASREQLLVYIEGSGEWQPIVEYREKTAVLKDGTEVLLADLKRGHTNRPKTTQAQAPEMPIKPILAASAGGLGAK